MLTPLDDRSGRTLALRWTAHDPTAYNLHLLDMAEARSVEEALTIAHDCGVPAQNFVVGDRSGKIAWTIIGRVPKRVGFDGSLPQSWADGTRRWDGFLAPEETPAIRQPADGQLWTANNRMVGGELLSRIGDGGYDLPARAAQIRDRLTALAGRMATPQDGLNVQLDDESRFLARWRGLLESTLTEEAVRTDPLLLELRKVVQAWHGHAAANEAGHRLVREFRQQVVEMVMNPIYEPVRQHAPELNLSRTRFKDGEEPVWAILAARPAYLLPTAELSWEGLLQHAACLTAATGRQEPGGRPLADCTWGEVNTLRMRHPFSPLLPAWLAAGLDMPALPLPGDNNMPRVQARVSARPSGWTFHPDGNRRVCFHQPGGASGHPLSPSTGAGTRIGCRDRRRRFAGSGGVSVGAAALR